MELKLTRYEGGCKGPVVAFHGLGVNSTMFSLDTIPINLVEYLVQHRYDVWLADWRVSCDLPWAVYQDYTLDDCAKHDHRTLINKVLQVTGQVSKSEREISRLFKLVSLFAALLKLGESCWRAGW